MKHKSFLRHLDGRLAGNKSPGSVDAFEIRIAIRTPLRLTTDVTMVLEPTRSLLGSSQDEILFIRHQRRVFYGLLLSGIAFVRQSLEQCLCASSNRNALGIKSRVPLNPLV